MTQTDVQGIGLELVFVINCDTLKIQLILRIGSNGVNVGALAERIVVTNADDVALQVGIAKSHIHDRVSSFGIDIAHAEHSLAAGNRSVTVRLSSTSSPSKPFLSPAV